MNFIVLLCVNLGQLAVGYSIGWSAPVVQKMLNDGIIDMKQMSWIGSSLYVGTMFGPYIAGYLSNRYGRRVAIMLSGSLMAISYVITMFAYEILPLLIFARIIGGFGASMISLMNIVYGGEVASASNRGIVLTTTGIFHCLGILLVYIVGPFASYKVLNSVVLSVCAIHLVTCVYIPESPIFYLIKGREEETIAILNALNRKKEAEELKSVLEKEKEDSNWEWKEFYTNKINRRSLIIAMPAFFFQSFNGLLAIMLFTTTIYKIAGSSLEPSMATIVSGTTQFAGTLIVPLLIEKLGRKTLMILSLAGCGMSMFVMGIYFFLHNAGNEIIESIRWLPLATMVVAIVSFSIGLNMIPNTLCSELFCSNVRSAGSSITLTFNNLTAFFCVVSFGYLTESIGAHYVFIIYGIINLLGIVYTIFIVPETKGMSLKEIQYMLAD